MDKPISVMIVDASESYRKLIGDLINAEEDMFLAGCAADGLEAAELAEELRPDVLITELLLRKMEGLTMLRRLKERESMPYTIVVTGFFNDALAEKASELGVARFFPKPCRISTLIESVRSSRDKAGEGNTSGKQPTAGKREREIEDALLQCGFNPYVRGWGYIKAAVEEAMEDESRLEGITKNLYPELARRFGTSPENFERCIRSAIENAWRDADSAAREAFFGAAAVQLGNKRPGNAKFIRLMARRLEKQG